MDILKILEQLAQVAKHEIPPETHVSPQVIMKIMEYKETSSFDMLSLFTCISSIAACIILFLGIARWLSLDTTAEELFAPLNLVMIYLEMIQ